MVLQYGCEGYLETYKETLKRIEKEFDLERLKRLSAQVYVWERRVFSKTDREKYCKSKGRGQKQNL